MHCNMVSKSSKQLTKGKYFKDGFCVREIVIHFRFMPDLTYITLNAQCDHPMLVKKTQAVTRVGLEPTTSCFLMQTS